MAKNYFKFKFVAKKNGILSTANLRKIYPVIKQKKKKRKIYLFMVKFVTYILVMTTRGNVFRYSEKETQNRMNLSLKK